MKKLRNRSDSTKTLDTTKLRANLILKKMDETDSPKKGNKN
jgi:hypothetical protein